MKREPHLIAGPAETSSYVGELPALYAEGPEGSLLGRFLLGFEQILTGLGEPESPGLEEILDGIPVPRSRPEKSQRPPVPGVQRFFDPGRAPADFLEWLAGWVALTLRADWTDEVRRSILSAIVPAYRLRGTPEGLKRVLAAFTGLQPQILESFKPFQVKDSSVVGVSTVLGGGPPHYFLVVASISAEQAGDLARQEEILRAVIDAEKPAHTFYDLRFDFPKMQIRVHSTVGVDTVLGTVAEGAPAGP